MFPISTSNSNPRFRDFAISRFFREFAISCFFANSRIRDSAISRFRNFRIPRFRDFAIPRFRDSAISRFRNSPLSRFHLVSGKALQRNCRVNIPEVRVSKRISSAAPRLLGQHHVSSLSPLYAQRGVPFGPRAHPFEFDKARVFL